MVSVLNVPRQIADLSLTASNFITLHPEMIHHLAGHALVHSLYSHVHSNRKIGLSRRLRRKNANMRRRWFVDNIIMHHKRLHDQNRELAVKNARSQIISRRDELKKKQQLALERAKNPHLDKEKKWQELVIMREKSQAVRGRIDARRIRARSRWLSVADEKKSSS